MCEPQISIVTINFNDNSGLRRTLASVANQEYRDFELIVVDGASTDGSQKVVEEFSGIISTSLSEPDEGIYDAMNKGLRLAKGSWLLFLNSGDALHRPDTLSNVASHLSDGSVTYFGRARIVTESGVAWTYPGARVSDANISSWLASHLPGHAAMFFPRSFYSANLYNRAYSISADSDYKLRALESSYIFIDERVCDFSFGGLSSHVTFASAYHQCKDRLRRTSGQGGVYYALACLAKMTTKFILAKLLGRGYYKILAFYHDGWPVDEKSA